MKETLLNIDWDSFENSAGSTFFNTRLWCSTLLQSYSNIEPCWVQPLKSFHTGGILLFKVKSLFTGTRLTTVPFHCYSETIGNDEQQMETQIKAILEYCREFRISQVEISSIHHQFDSIFKKNGFSISDYYISPVIELNRSYPSVCSRYKKHFAANLLYSKRKIEKSLQLEFMDASPKEYLHHFYRLLLHQHKTKHNNLLPPESFYRNLFQADKTGANAKLFILRDRGKVIAGAVLLLHQKTAYYGWSASDMKYEKWSVSTYFLDRIIEFFCEAGYSHFDLSPVSPLNEGLVFFKTRWGSQLIRPHIYTYCFREKVHQTLDEARDYKTIRRLLRFLPNPFYRLLTFFGYKHLA